MIENSDLHRAPLALYALVITPTVTSSSYFLTIPKPPGNSVLVGWRMRGALPHVGPLSAFCEADESDDSAGRAGAFGSVSIYPGQNGLYLSPRTMSFLS